MTTTHQDFDAVADAFALLEAVSAAAGAHSRNLDQALDVLAVLEQLQPNDPLGDAGREACAAISRSIRSAAHALALLEDGVGTGLRSTDTWRLALTLANQLNANTTTTTQEQS